MYAVLFTWPCAPGIYAAESHLPLIEIDVGLSKTSYILAGSLPEFQRVSLVSLVNALSASDGHIYLTAADRKSRRRELLI